MLADHLVVGHYRPTGLLQWEQFLVAMGREIGLPSTVKLRRLQEGQYPKCQDLHRPRI